MRLQEILSEMILREAKPSRSDQKGTLELRTTKYKTVKSFINTMIEKYGKFPDFGDYIKRLEKHLSITLSGLPVGVEKRKDMPVVNSNQVNALQSRLEQGRLDVIDGASLTVYKSFPAGLSEAKAQEWLEKGLNDGDEGDDIIRVSITTKIANTLIPIQKDIYLDKSIEMTFRKGLENMKSFLKNKSFIIVSPEGYIIDGHHRWLSAMLIDPQMYVQTMMINLPKDRLIDLLTTYGDAIGNERNK